MTAWKSVEGRTVIVTGAASGMGQATAALLALDGARVAVVDIDAVGARRTSDDIVDRGGEAAAFACDLADADAIEAMVHAVRERFGPIDIVVNNAGVGAGGAIDSDDYEDQWAHTFAVNAEAPMRLVRACIDDLRRNNDGRIVNIASTEGLQATPNTSPYTASKHAIVGFTKAIAVEQGRHGVTSNAICPGPIETGMTKDIPDEAKQTYARRRVPLRRYGQPEEIAHMVLALVSPGASFVNGAIIPVDGGLTIKSN